VNDSTRHPLHDALHAHVRESGRDAAGPCLAGLADGALRVARRRQRLARAGAGVIAAAVLATAGVAVADGATWPTHLGQPAAGSTGTTVKAARLSILPVTSVTEHACAHGGDGYLLPRTPTSPASCVQVDRANGMTDVRALSAKAHSGPAGWEVVLVLRPADRTRLADLTSVLATAAAPRNELAVVIDGKLRDVASVAAPLTGGRFAVAGNLTSETAHDLALRLGTGR
jgi:SecD-like export protein